MKKILRFGIFFSLIGLLFTGYGAVMLYEFGMKSDYGISSVFVGLLILLFGMLNIMTASSGNFFTSADK